MSETTNPNHLKYVCELYNGSIPTDQDIELLHEQGLRFYIKGLDQEQAIELAVQQAGEKGKDSFYLETLRTGAIIHSGPVDNLSVGLKIK